MAGSYAIWLSDSGGGLVGVTFCVHVKLVAATAPAADGSSVRLRANVPASAATGKRPARRFGRDGSTLGGPEQRRVAMRRDPVRTVHIGSPPPCQVRDFTERQTSRRRRPRRVTAQEPEHLLEHRCIRRHRNGRASARSLEPRLVRDRRHSRRARTGSASPPHLVRTPCHLPAPDPTRGRPTHRKGQSRRLRPGVLDLPPESCRSTRPDGAMPARDHRGAGGWTSPVCVEIGGIPRGSHGG